MCKKTITMPLTKRSKNISPKIAINDMCLGIHLQIHKIFYGRKFNSIKVHKKTISKRKGICVWLEMSILLKNKFLTCSRILNRKCTNSFLTLYSRIQILRDLVQSLCVSVGQVKQVIPSRY